MHITPAISNISPLTTNCTREPHSICSHISLPKYCSFFHINHGKYTITKKPSYQTCIKTSSVATGSADMVCPCPPLILTFDHLTLKLVCESHLRWGTFLPNLGTLGVWVLKLFAMYATNGQTDGGTKATLIVRFPTVGGIIKKRSMTL